MNIFSFIKNWLDSRSRKKLMKKRLDELRKQDPFIYK
jgi:hypothetical protein